MLAVLLVERFARRRSEGWLATAGMAFRSAPFATFAARRVPAAFSTSTVSAVPAAVVSLVKSSVFQHTHGAGAMVGDVSVPAAG